METFAEEPLRVLVRVIRDPAAFTAKKEVVLISEHIALARRLDLCQAPSQEVDVEITGEDELLIVA